MKNLVWVVLASSLLLGCATYNKVAREFTERCYYVLSEPICRTTIGILDFSQEVWSAGEEEEEETDV